MVCYLCDCKCEKASWKNVRVGKIEVKAIVCKDCKEGQ